MTATMVRTRNTHTGELTKQLFADHEEAQTYAATACEVPFITVTMTQVQRRSS